MVNNNDEIAHWRDLLEQYRVNLRTQRKQQANFARGEERLALLNQIVDWENKIREAKAKLRQLGNDIVEASLRASPTKYASYA